MILQFLSSKGKEMPYCGKALTDTSFQGDRSFPTSEYNMFLYEELACGVALTKTLPVEKLEKQPSLGSLANNTDPDSESVEGENS